MNCSFTLLLKVSKKCVERSINFFCTQFVLGLYRILHIIYILYVNLPQNLM